MQFYVWRSARAFGPLTEKELLELVKKGEVSEETLGVRDFTSPPPISHRAWVPLRTLLPEALEVSPKTQPPIQAQSATQPPDGAASKESPLDAVVLVLDREPESKDMLVSKILAAIPPVDGPPLQYWMRETTPVRTLIHPHCTRYFTETSATVLVELAKLLGWEFSKANVKMAGFETGTYAVSGFVFSHWTDARAAKAHHKIFLALPGGERQGPYTLEEIKARPHVFGDDGFWAWYEGMKQWMPLHSIPGVQSNLAEITIRLPNLPHWTDPDGRGIYCSFLNWHPWNTRIDGQANILVVDPEDGTPHSDAAKIAKRAWDYLQKNRPNSMFRLESLPRIQELIPRKDPYIYSGGGEYVTLDQYIYRDIDLEAGKKRIRFLASTEELAQSIILGHFKDLGLIEVQDKWAFRLTDLGRKTRIEFESAPRYD